MYLNNKPLLQNQQISFGNSSQLIISCTSINSRPLVDIKIFNPKTNMSLPSIPSSAISPNPLIFCSSDGNCITSLKIKLTPGYAGFNNISSLACEIKNFTYPFSLYSKVIHQLEFDGKSIKYKENVM